jgi:hypothetical protein
MPKDVPSYILTPAFLQGFLGIRANGVVLNALRVNDMDTPRRSFLQVVQRDAKEFNGGTLTQEGEEPPVSILFYVTTGGGNRRSLMLRGLIDAYIERDDNDLPIWSGAMMRRIDAYGAALKSKSLAVRVLQPADANNPDRPLVSLAPKQGDSGQTTVTYQAGVLDLVAGKPVIMHGIPRTTLPGYTGPLPCSNVTPTSFDVPVMWRSPSVVLPVRNGSVRTAVYALDPILSLNAMDMRTKRTGRPTGQSRGHRSGVKYRSR